MKLELVDGSEKHRLTIFSTLLVESPYLFKGPIMWRLNQYGDDNSRAFSILGRGHVVTSLGHWIYAVITSEPFFQVP